MTETAPAKPRIIINGVGITQAEIDAEVQYHPSASFFDAQEEAARALVVREILLQRAAKLGLCTDPKTTPEKAIEELLAREVTVPEADAESCRRYYENNHRRFHTTPLFEAAHILFLAPPDDETAKAASLAKANKVLEEIKRNPGRFEALAAEYSACSSGKSGGHLGQLSKGQTLPAFEAALNNLQTGELCTAPVLTEVGFHIIKVHRRVDGAELPFEAVQGWIAGYLKNQSWQRAVKQYIQLLAGEADIKGYSIQGADSPLVQ